MYEIEAIALSNVQGLNLKVKRQLLDKFQSPAKVLEMAMSVKTSHSDVDHALTWIKRHVDLKTAKAQFIALQKIKAFCLVMGQKDYPPLLTQISDPPIVLYAKGQLPDWQSNFLAVVGPRKPTLYGKRIAKWLCRDLAKEGLNLVSGLALGIDTIAHQEALAVSSKTIAVIATGLDGFYPKQNIPLQNKIAEEGLLVTEFGLNTPPKKDHFPRRNRIIAGLSTGVLVVEAGEKSGARITARHAMDQAKEVYCVPGPIDSEQSMFTNLLISQGAKMVLNSQSVLDDFGFASSEKNTQPLVSKKQYNFENENQKRLFLELDFDCTISSDELCDKLNMPIGTVLSLLTELEMKNLVQVSQDGRWFKKP